MFFTVDFEDFSYDQRRNFGIKLKIDCSEILWRKYEIINRLLQKLAVGEKNRATFFCTGILAERNPDLISQIAKDGHEVACHYHYHDLMKNQSLAEIEKMLQRAKDKLADTSMTEIRGFRAPCFAIDKVGIEQYQLVQKYFDYDSSLFCSSDMELQRFREKMGLEKLILIPVTSARLPGFDFRLGGTFLKLFPVMFSKYVIKLSKQNSMTPNFYIHPYEFGLSPEFSIKFSEFRGSGMGIIFSALMQLRQSQWLHIGNTSVEQKILALANISPVEGTIASHISAIENVRN